MKDQNGKTMTEKEKRIASLKECMAKLKSAQEPYVGGSSAWVLLQAAFGHVTSLHHLEAETKFAEETLGVKNPQTFDDGSFEIEDEKKNKDYIKRNRCPYCTYPCDSATMVKGENDRPEPGSISFCLMCCEPATWDYQMNLVKFDLNSIPDLLERNRIKVLGLRVSEYWDLHPCKDGRREKYLKIMDRRCK